MLSVNWRIICESWDKTYCGSIGFCLVVTFSVKNSAAFAIDINLLTFLLLTNKSIDGRENF